MFIFATDKNRNFTPYYKIKMKRLAFSLFLLLSLVTVCRAQFDKDVFMFRGRQALSEGRYADAISQFNILARLDSTDSWVFFYRGISKYNLGDIRGAQGDFDNSVRLNPVFTNGYHFRAITLSRSGKYDEALADFDRAMELRPGLIGLYFSRGVTYFLAQRFENAVSDFDRYIRKEPKDPSAYLNRGASYLFLADTTKALADYNKAISLDRFDPEGYIRRGRVYALQKNYKGAIADMDKAISLDTTNTFAYFNRALMFYESNDYNSAMADLNRVLRENLKDYMECVNWFMSEVEGDPVILEAYGLSYTDYNIVSAYTGLPTVCGWQTHEWLWRFHGIVDKETDLLVSDPERDVWARFLTPRHTDIDTIYTSQDIGTIKNLIDTYDISYVVLGDLERSKYNGYDNTNNIASLGRIVFVSGNLTVIQIFD